MLIQGAVVMLLAAEAKNTQVGGCDTLFRNFGWRAFGHPEVLVTF